jgi:asparagine synthase (glutamine-hydrolysing)
MCGFAGFLDTSHGHSSEQSTAIAQGMAATLRHRGPDDCGAWTDAPAGFSVAHQRLSVIDLSDTGHQPMKSSNGRYVIAYNGEVYNFKELKAELAAAGARFHGHSDTEVILEGCALWGIETLLHRLNGMFAFALWDRETRSLVLARDRIGIKPLYYGRHGNAFLFGSELKALATHPAWSPKIDREAVAALLARGYIPTPLSIYQDIVKLRPGHYVTLQHGTEPSERCYWDLAQVVSDGLVARDQISEADALSELEGKLQDAVARRMIADVPLGAFLSGGIDSSLVVALMQEQSTRPVKTFSIGFDESAYDEAQFAKQVASHLGTDHTELYVTPEQALDVVPKLPTMYDEPFADSSQIPTHLVSALARDHVTVALSGDGGDEGFTGYNHYFVADAMERRLGRLPKGLRHLLAATANTIGRSGFGARRNSADAQKIVRGGRERWWRAEGLLRADDFSEVYQNSLCHWRDAGKVVGLEPAFGDEPFHLLPTPGDRFDRMQHTDLAVYLPDDILTKVDRASMAVSLEVRVPLLDHTVIEHGWKMPSDLKVRDGVRKWALRQILYKRVPKDLIERPKRGFAVPVGQWVRGPLRDWAEDLLDEHSLGDGGILDPIAVRERWSEHMEGRADWTSSLWDVLMFEAWRRNAGLSGD